MQKISLNTGDSTDYYLAIPPMSGNAVGALIVLVSFGRPESMIPVTRLHNMASANSLLTVYASTSKHLLPNRETLHWVGDLLVKVSATWHIYATSFALGGSDLAGTIALRYAVSTTDVNARSGRTSTRRPSVTPVSISTC